MHLKMKTFSDFEGFEYFEYSFKLPKDKTNIRFLYVLVYIFPLQSDMQFVKSFTLARFLRHWECRTLFSSILNKLSNKFQAKWLVCVNSLKVYPSPKIFFTSTTCDKFHVCLQLDFGFKKCLCWPISRLPKCKRSIWWWICPKIPVFLNDSGWQHKMTWQLHESRCHIVQSPPQTIGPLSSPWVSCPWWQSLVAKMVNWC